MKLYPNNPVLQVALFVAMSAVAEIAVSLVLGRTPFQSGDTPYWLLLLKVALAISATELLLYCWTRRCNKRRRKEMNDQYGKLFDEAGV